MSTITRSGYEQDAQGIFIAKDPEAELVYTFDWSEWLPTGDTISTVSYTLQVRANDPAPMTRISQGVQSGTKTYVELGGGQVGKVYTVTAEVTTADGSIDRRSFRVKVENRSA
jgi:uncharacterized protein YndB with AHSA1/START domain